MKRVKMIVAYDGTNYCGWQLQPNGITIEQVLNEHLSRLLEMNYVIKKNNPEESYVLYIIRKRNQY